MGQRDCGENGNLMGIGSTGGCQAASNTETSIEAAMETDRPGSENSGPGFGWSRLERSKSFRFLIALVIVGLYGFFFFELIKNQF